MAVAFDAAASSTGFAATAAALSWTHTAGASAGTALAGIAWGSTSFPPTVTAATYGGAAMTVIPAGGQASGGSGSNGGILLYGITGQTAGSKTVSFTFSAAPADLVVGNSISFTGASGFGTPVKNSGSGTAVSVALPGTTAGNLCCAMECHGTNGAITWTAGTQRFDDEVSAGSGASNLSGATLAAGGTVTLTETIQNDVWAAIGVEVQVAGGVTATATLVQGAAAVQTVSIVSNVLSIGPRYAGTAADLGGGYGAWNTPQFATGGP